MKEGVLFCKDEIFINRSQNSTIIWFTDFVTTSARVRAEVGKVEVSEEEFPTASGWCYHIENSVAEKG